ncbi:MULTISPECIES: DUF6069 family protein [unclassified Haladaptatus]|uniref:DUF6069 family protein n=1 Tax=unclassified Haladaptatus TaxID=2622732 RepID=UPI0023E76F96|nr:MULTISPECIES: DUF6069 family protein [unclassified Haladaptatus]
MASTTVSPIARTNLTMGDLARRGVLALVISLVAVLIARGIIGALLTVPTGFDPLNWGAIVFVTTISAVGATIVYGLLDRFTKRVTRNFLVAAAIAFVVETIPLFTVAPLFPGATSTLIAVTLGLHIIVAVGIVASLLRGPELVRRRRTATSVE